MGLWSGFGNNREEQWIHSFLWVLERLSGVWPGSSHREARPTGGRRGGGVDDNDTGRRHLLPLNQSESQFPFPGDLATILRTRGVSFWASESPIPPRLADRSQVHGPFQATGFG